MGRWAKEIRKNLNRSWDKLPQVRYTWFPIIEYWFQESQKEKESHWKKGRSTSPEAYQGNPCITSDRKSNLGSEEPRGVILRPRKLRRRVKDTTKGCQAIGEGSTQHLQQKIRNSIMYHYGWFRVLRVFGLYGELYLWWKIQIRWKVVWGLANLRKPGWK